MFNSRKESIRHARHRAREECPNKHVYEGETQAPYPLRDLVDKEGTRKCEYVIAGEYAWYIHNSQRW